MQKTEVEEPKQLSRDEVLSTVKDAASKILLAVYLALFALLIFLAGIFLSAPGRSSGTETPGSATSALAAVILVLLLLAFFAGRKWELRYPRRPFKMISYPKGELLWKGYTKDGSVETMPYCPDHGIRLFVRNTEYYCPKCGSKRFSRFRSVGASPSPLVEQLGRGAASIMQGFIDRKVSL